MVDKLSLHEPKIPGHGPKKDAGGGMAYVLVYWLAKAVVAGMFLAAAVYTASKSGMLKIPFGLRLPF